MFLYLQNSNYFNTRNHTLPLPGMKSFRVRDGPSLADPLFLGFPRFEFEPRLEFEPRFWLPRPRLEAPSRPPFRPNNEFSQKINRNMRIEKI